MKAKVISVYDEGSLVGTQLIGSRGLAILVDVDGERTLFDTGTRGRYLMRNLGALEIDPDSVTRVVISHAHAGHVGGLEAFLEKRSEKIDVLTTTDNIDAQKKFLGIPSGKITATAEMSAKMNVIEVTEWTKLSEHLFITGKIPADDGTQEIEENALILMTKNGPVLICGCCHFGLARMISFVTATVKKKPAAVIGGTHMLKMKRKEVHAVAETIKKSGPPVMYLNNCTGTNQRTYMREKLGLDAVKEFYAGTEIRFET